MLFLTSLALVTFFITKVIKSQREKLLEIALTDNTSKTLRIIQPGKYDISIVGKRFRFFPDLSKYDLQIYDAVGNKIDLHYPLMRTKITGVKMVKYVIAIAHLTPGTYHVKIEEIQLGTKQKLFRYKTIQLTDNAQNLFYHITTHFSLLNIFGLVLTSIMAISTLLGSILFLVFSLN